MKVRIQVALMACAAMLAVPAFASAQARAVRVAPRAAVGVRVAPRVVVRGYYAPYYYGGFYDPFWYGAYGWYGPGWYGSPYWYPPYGYQRGYYGGGASLKLEVTPKNAQVFVDGYYAGVVDDFDGIFQSLDLAPGEHDVQLYLPGFRSIEQKVYLQPGKTFRVKYAMEPLRPGDPEPVRPAAVAPPPPEYPQQQPPPQTRRGGPRQLPPGAPRAGVSVQRGYGAVAIRVQPADADVLIDGERWNGSQSGDRLEVQLAAGTHNVEVRKDGFRAYSTDVLVQDGQTATLNVALTRQ